MVFQSSSLRCFRVNCPHYFWLCKRTTSRTLTQASLFLLLYKEKDPEVCSSYRPKCWLLAWKHSQFSKIHLRLKLHFTLKKCLAGNILSWGFRNLGLVIILFQLLYEMFHILLPLLQLSLCLSVLVIPSSVSTGPVIVLYIFKQTNAALNWNLIWLHITQFTRK